VQLLEDRCQPSAVGLDPTFGTGGQVTPAITPNSVLVQPWDGKIILAGSNGGFMSLARYNTDGTLDGAFGNSGVEVSTFAGGGVGGLYPQTGSANDGKIVEAGGSSVVRFNANGSVDTSFGSSGKITLPWSGNIGNVLIQPDGKVVVCGIVTSPSKILEVTRVNANGTLDNSFATNGTWQTSLTVAGNQTHWMFEGYAALQADGMLLVMEPRDVLTPGFGWFVDRLTTSGALDPTYTRAFTSFASVYNAPNGMAEPGGMAVYPASDAADAGKSLAVGFTLNTNYTPTGTTVLARYDSDGTLDTTFGTGGKAIGANSGTNALVTGVAIQADGKAIVVGANIQRYNTDGTLDTSFGAGGIIATRYTAVAIQPDTKIDVSSSNVLARYLASDAPPPNTFLCINNVSVVEGNDATSLANFTVTLSAASADEVTVQFLTADGSAQSGSDFQSTGGTLTFAPGETSQSIAVPILGDRIGESDETFFVNLSNAVNAGYANYQGTGTIVDDEPRIAINDVSMTEGNSGTKSFVFTVTLSAAYDQPVTVNYQTANGAATTSDHDYVASSGTLTFNPGETQKTITITVNGDKKKESDETFFVNLSGNSGNSLLVDSQGIGTILNDD
jgi:uncharacterized delta-60 repeat protein